MEEYNTSRKWGKGQYINEQQKRHSKIIRIEKMKKENPYALCITVSCNNKHESQWINPNKLL